MAFTALNNPPALQPRVQAPAPSPTATATATATVSATVVQAEGARAAHAHDVDAAFAGSPDLRKRVHAAIDRDRSQATLFHDISTYILAQRSQPPPEPATKKRRLEERNGAQQHAAAPPPAMAAAPAAPAAPAASTTHQSAGSSLASASTKPFASYPAISFSMPQRKKFTLELVDQQDGGIRAIGAAGAAEFALAWKHVDQVFCLPVPEKAKKQHNFVVIPVHGDGVTPIPEHLKASAPEPLVWTFEEPTGKNIVEGEDPGPGPMAEAIHHCLIHARTAKEVVFPDASEFASAIPESHRKAEKAYHVKAHRGSKEGTSGRCSYSLQSLLTH